MKKSTSIFLMLFIAVFLYSCGDDDNSTPEDDGTSMTDDDGTSMTDDDVTVTLTAADAVANYAEIVYQNYLDSYNAALTMQTAITDFLGDPTADNLEAAKDAWLAAREPYGQSEAFRFASGPIDTAQESGEPSWALDNEGQMNAWPMDESYVDYVAELNGFAGTFSSLISDDTFDITAESIASANEDESDKSISTGWHAIEFLLWGQDNTAPSALQAGQREFTDYTTLEDADRRGEYLRVATALLVSDLNDLVQTWAPDGEYRTVFEALDAEVALQQAVFGAFGMAGFEVSGERMIAAVDSTDGIDGSGQEDEHSCFSDNTHRDMTLNVQGIANVLTGNYGSISGTSFVDLVTQANATQGASLQAAIDAAVSAAENLSTLAGQDQPFDLLLTQETTDNPGPVVAAAQALITLSDEISASATAIGIDLGALPE
ncbi:MAG: imelysin family protein [Bacteroidota bacterium]